MLNDDYAHAKACGIIGKSFLGKKISSLAGLHSLSELDRLIFPDIHRDLPGRELLVDLEHRITKRAVKQILVIVNSYPVPPEILVRMLRVYEYNNIKLCLQNISLGKKELPLLCDIGRFRTVNFQAFPDIEAMLKGTEFISLLSQDLKSLQQAADQQEFDFSQIETKLDAHYYFGLAESLSLLSSEDRKAAQRILSEEISLRNCVWALRLRTYYQKTASETGKFLMDIKLPGANREKNPSLASEAVKSLELPLDSRLPWRGWKWEKFLNPEEASAHWTANPRHFQNAASQYLYRLAFRFFHRFPMEVSKIFCFIKLKQFEEDFLTSIAEGLSLGIDSTSVFKLLEVSL